MTESSNGRLEELFEKYRNKVRELDDAYYEMERIQELRKKLREEAKEFRNEIFRVIHNFENLHPEALAGI